MTTKLLISNQELQNKIHIIRSLPVMLDRDLAVLYEVKTIRLREQVKRNSKRFPADFMFQLTMDEVEILVSQNAIPSKKNLGGTMPYVFINDLFRNAKQSIVLIDNYIDDSVLMQLAKRPREVSATILTKSVQKNLIQDLKKHNMQYPPIVIHEFVASHDRFLIIDGKIVYHIGASLKDLGKKWFAFSRMDATILNIMGRIESLLKQVNLAHEDNKQCELFHE